MNPYVVDGILRDVRAGKRVVVVSESGGSAQHAHRTLARQVDETQPDVKVRRTNGDERIDIGEGTAYFLSVRSQGGRGLTADVVFVDTDATTDQLEHIAVMTGVPGGVVHLR